MSLIVKFSTTSKKSSLLNCTCLEKNQENLEEKSEKLGEKNMEIMERKKNSPIRMTLSRQRISFVFCIFLDI